MRWQRSHAALAVGARMTELRAVVYVSAHTGLCYVMPSGHSDKAGAEQCLGASALQNKTRRPRWSSQPNQGKNYMWGNARGQHQAGGRAVFRLNVATAEKQ